jgi:hypothetical protein
MIGVQYDLFLNNFKKWDKKEFYILLTIGFSFVEKSLFKKIEFKISGTEKGYTLQYLKNGLHNVGENLNFDSLNEMFQTSCIDIILQYTNHFQKVHFLSLVKLESQGHEYEIDQLKYYNKKEYTLLKLLKII